MMMSNRIELKVVLLGKEFGGKTSLVERFISGQFFGENRYQNTIGTAFRAKRIVIQGKGNILMGIWDTAGSERYQSISRLYYRSAKAAILCYDVTDAESWIRLGYWLAEVREREPNCRLYICATKIDLLENSNHKRVTDYCDSVDLAEEYDAKLFETSSKTGQKVAELFEEIARDFLTDSINLGRTMTRSDTTVLDDNSCGSDGKKSCCQR